MEVVLLPGPELAQYGIATFAVAGLIFVVTRFLDNKSKWVLDLDKLKAEKRAQISEARWRAETGGLTLPDGTVVKTDRESQSLLMGAALFAKEDPTYVVNWKGANGWVTLDASTILQLGAAVRQHVQACFDKEKALHDMIDAATTVEEIKSITWDSIP